MKRPLILDLFCGVGGASVGYHRAGFDVIGVDQDPQPDYPFEFHQADVFTWLIEHTLDLNDFDAVHASPPCQDRIAITAGNRGRPGWTDNHVNLVPPTREALTLIRRFRHRPTVMECGVGRHIRRDIRLCGEMFDLAVLRHRWFEIDGAYVAEPFHRPHRGKVAGMRHGQWQTGPYFAVYGEGGGKGTVPEWQKAMGLDWTENRKSIAEAIPPAYSEHIGRRLLEHLESAR